MYKIKINSREEGGGGGGSSFSLPARRRAKGVQRFRNVLDSPLHIASSRPIAGAREELSVRIDIFTPCYPNFESWDAVRHMALKLISMRWIEQESAINTIRSNYRFADLDVEAQNSSAFSTPTKHNA